jgi:hypothetical protein
MADITIVNGVYNQLILQESIVTIDFSDECFLLSQMGIQLTNMEEPGQTCGMNILNISDTF